MAGIVVRRMQPGDYDMLRALDDAVMRYSARAFLGFDWDGATPERREEQRAITPESFAFYIQTPCSFVAEEGAETVGYVLAQTLRHFDLEPLAVWVEDISVHPDRHRRGIASALYRTLHEWGQSAGATAILAGIHVDNAASLAMHRQVGFALYESRTAVWRLD
ncbi:MAG: GNAT family N-acetyltransferase [Thermomicrobia bacterium]|nr:GNAT family N-acetyltransferase [Thermomicrobia bacterium]